MTTNATTAPPHAQSRAKAPNQSDLQNVIAKFTANDVAGVVVGSINGNTPYIADCNGSSQNSTGLRFLTNSTTQMTISTTGNVGIGTTSPSGQLHISSGTNGDCQLILQADTDNNNETDNPMILFRQDGATDRAMIGTNSNDLEIATSANGYISFKTISSMHFYSWKKGLKTGMYYLRSRPSSKAIQFTVAPETCESCSG